MISGTAKKRRTLSSRWLWAVGFIVLVLLLKSTTKIRSEDIVVEYRDDYYARLLGVERKVQRRKNVTLPTVAACVRIRNEARYLKEWLEFHRLVGVSVFYIFDDGSTDDTRSILEPYQRSGEVLLWQISDKKCHQDDQSVCADRKHDALHGERGFRDECLRKNPKNADWILMTDVDEFAFPTGAARSLPEHLAGDCQAPAYYLLRWHVFGAGGHIERPEASSIESYQLRGREDDCFPRFTCGDDKSPPVCAKVLAKAGCVLHQGTHYVLETASSCQNIYTGDRKMTQLKNNDEYAIQIHEQCAASIHLNHYAVRSRRDFIDKFERGRISSSARDAHLGIADSRTRIRTVSNSTIRTFMQGKQETTSKKANAAKSTADLLLLEFSRRDHSEVLDDTVLPLAARLRQRLHTPALTQFNCPKNSSLFIKKNYHAAKKKKNAVILFAHIPKTGGTSLNLALQDAAAMQSITFRILDFAHLDKKADRTHAVQNYQFLSAETDLSFPFSIYDTTKKNIFVFTILRDPISRLASQYEHHLAAGRIRNHQNRHKTYGDIIRLASPRLCSQLERDQFQCNTLAHPRKCRAGGFCTIFQNHQTHVLAGAQHFSKSIRSAARQSSAHLLCAATQSLEALFTVGITERLPASLCLLFHTLEYSHVYKQCCHDASRTCSILAPHTSKHSAADRGAIFSSTLTNQSSSNYLSKYIENDLLLAAMYEGNVLDCLIYGRAIRLLQHRLQEMRSSPTVSTFDQENRKPSYAINSKDIDNLMRHCRLGKDAADKLLPPRGTALLEAYLP